MLKLFSVVCLHCKDTTKIEKLKYIHCLFHFWMCYLLKYPIYS